MASLEVISIMYLWATRIHFHPIYTLNGQKTVRPEFM